MRGRDWRSEVRDDLNTNKDIYALCALSCASRSSWRASSSNFFDSVNERNTSCGFVKTPRISPTPKKPRLAPSCLRKLPPACCALYRLLPT